MYAEKQPIRTPATPGGAGPSPSAAPEHDSAAGKPSKRISRTEYLYSESLNPAQRTAVIDQLYEIYCETVCGDSREVFEALVFGAGDVRIALFYGADAELAGYSYVATERLAYAGRAHAVFCAGVFFRLGYRGGPSSAVFGLTHALRFKLREPRTRLAYVTRSTTPAVYRLIASTMPRSYPSPMLETPDYVEALIPVLSARRGYVPVTANPWVVREDTSLREPTRMDRLDNDPYVRFYTEFNPRYAEGESVITWASLDWHDIVRALSRVLRAGLVR